jgi:subtilase family serine protease
MTVPRRGLAAIVAGCVITAAGAALGAPGSARAAAAPAAVPVPGSAAAAAASGTLVGALPAARPLTVQVWLTPRLAGAEAFADAAATPGSPGFHRYLSPDAYTAAFGPSAAQAAAVSRWLTAAGLTGVRADRGRDYVSATGLASKIAAAFAVHVNQYRVTSADGKAAVAYANDRAVSVPAALAPDVLGVTGLESAPPATPRPAAAAQAPAAKAPACSRYWAQYTASFRPAYRGLTKGALPVCGYSASQLRAAYGATTAATGKGVTVALTENAPPVQMLRTLTEWARASRLPAPKAAQYRQRQVGTPGCTQAAARPADPQNPTPPEAEMDSEAVYAMAPGASQLMLVAGGCAGDQDLLDTELTVLAGNGAHPSATIISNSWVMSGGVPLATVHAVDLRAAAEGVGLYYATGDTPGTDSTATADPYVLAVGGTTLGIGSRGNRLFETGWSDDNATLAGGKWTDNGIASAAGGGVTADYREPAYQQGVVPAAMARVRAGNKVVAGRVQPDIAADGDVDSGLLVGFFHGTDSAPGPYTTGVNAGTSLACPLIAGLVADAQQGQRASFGFINPLIYRLAGTPALHDIRPPSARLPEQDRDAYAPAGASVDVFDFQGSAGTRQVTASGYDTMTGVGTPDGAAFIAALRRWGRPWSGRPWSGRPWSGRPR